MQKLIDGVHHFQQGVFGSQREFFEKLVAGQRPMALFITCSDSRISPNLITQTEPGELFVMRNAGNIVPPHGVGMGGTGGEAATVEFAVSVLGVPDIVVTTSPGRCALPPGPLTRPRNPRPPFSP